jgi:hypothetical protein
LTIKRLQYGVSLTQESRRPASTHSSRFVDDVQLNRLQHAIFRC